MNKEEMLKTIYNLIKERTDRVSTEVKSIMKGYVPYENS